MEKKIPFGWKKFYFTIFATGSMISVFSSSFLLNPKFRHIYYKTYIRHEYFTQVDAPFVIVLIQLAFDAIDWANNEQRIQIKRILDIKKKKNMKKRKRENIHHSSRKKRKSMCIYESWVFARNPFILNAIA